MATAQHKAFCVLESAKSESQVTVQRAPRPKPGIKPPTRKSISRWCTQFKQTGSACKGKSSGQPLISEDGVRRIGERFDRSPRKSTNRAS